MPIDPIPDWVIQYRRHIGTRLYDLRMARGWTQEQLAERTGIARETISEWENGNHSPLLDHLVIVCDALAVPVRRLFE